MRRCCWKADGEAKLVAQVTSYARKRASGISATWCSQLHKDMPANPTGAPMSLPPALIVLSHLRWDFVFQRPQHLMSRLADHYRVYFVEEPQITEGAPRLELRGISPTLTVCVPHTTNPAPGFHDDQLPALEMLLEELVERLDLQAPLV